MINFGANHPDLYYQRRWLGVIRFQGKIVKVNANYGCFMTAHSYEKLPENLKVNILNLFLLLL